MKSSTMMTPKTMSLLCMSLVVGGAAAVTLSVASDGGNATSGYQYGLMFEDINHSGEGGVYVPLLSFFQHEGLDTDRLPRYAELIQNRAFQGSTTYPSTLDPWTAIGAASLSLTNSSALSSALPTSVVVTASADGVVGIKNPGYWGSKSCSF